MSLVCAGHPAPFHLGSDGRVRQLGRPQPMLGVLDAPVYTAEEHVLERGDLLVTVTDGVLERRDGTRMLGEDGVQALLAHTGEVGAQAVAERIRRSVLDFSASPQQDDMAVLAFRVRP
jgi:serine phosphatase RsbU (regulator of sigma subunit)